MTTFFLCIAVAALLWFGLNMFGIAYCVRLGDKEAARHAEYQSIGWAIASALFFIAAKVAG